MKKLLFMFVAFVCMPLYVVACKGKKNTVLNQRGYRRTRRNAVVQVAGIENTVIDLQEERDFILWGAAQSRRLFHDINVRRYFEKSKILCTGFTITR